MKRSLNQEWKAAYKAALKAGMGTHVSRYMAECCYDSSLKGDLVCARHRRTQKHFRGFCVQFPVEALAALEKFCPTLRALISESMLSEVIIKKDWLLSGDAVERLKWPDELSPSP